MTELSKDKSLQYNCSSYFVTAPSGVLLVQCFAPPRYHTNPKYQISCRRKIINNTMKYYSIAALFLLIAIVMLVYIFFVNQKFIVGRLNCEGRLSQISLMIMNYYNTHNNLPPPVSHEGFSWRTLISLAQSEERHFFSKLNLSQDNFYVLTFFQCPYYSNKDTHLRQGVTNYLAIVTSDNCWYLPPPQQIKSGHILLVICDPSSSTFVNEPKDLTIDQAKIILDKSKHNMGIFWDIEQCKTILKKIDKNDLAFLLQLSLSIDCPGVSLSTEGVQPISSAPKTPDFDANSGEKSETSNVDTNDSIDKSDQKD